MRLLESLGALIREHIVEWRALRIDDLQFWHRGEARLALLALVAVSLVLLIARSAVGRRPGRHRIVVAAVLSSLPASRGAFIVHAPLLLFVAGLPFMILALADPYSSLVSREVTYPGRRIVLAIDASSSMAAAFRAERLNKRAATDSVFFTTVAAAERFVQLRMKGQYRDLIALVEFGDRAYVITPFTNDYDNILLSISLIGDPVEFSLFPDQGTFIGQAIEQSTALFRAFNFLDASGNLLVMFTDGEDTRTVVNGRPLAEVVQSAVEAHIPVYLVRTNFTYGKRRMIPDELWIPTVERTGGRFYAASDEDSLLRAIDEIDRAGTGTIALRQYSSQRPQHAQFVAIALACWIVAASLKLGVPYLRKLP